MDKYLSVDPKSVSYGQSGGDRTITISSNATWKIAVTDKEGKTVDWLTADVHSGEGDKTITLTAGPNNSGKEQTAYVIFKVDGTEIADTVSVTQGITERYVSVDPKELVFGQNGESKQFNITGDAKFEISIADEKGDSITWLTADKNKDEVSARNGKTITLTAIKNPSTEKRDAVVKVICLDDPTKSADVSVLQLGQAELTPAENAVEFDVNSSTRELTINTNVGFAVTIKYDDVKGDSWLTVSPDTINKTDIIDGKAVVTLTAEENEGSQERTANLLIEYTGPNGKPETVSVAVSQIGKPATPKLTINDRYYDETIKAYSSTISEKITLSVSSDDVIDESRWIYTWYENGKFIANGKNYEFTPEKRKYTFGVTIEYDSLRTIKDSTVIEFYPSPVAPAKLILKGNGNSGILIATFEGLSDSEMKDYSFVFGYDNKECTTKGYSYRYYQYGNSIVADNNIKKWVRTQWEIAGKPIQSRKIDYDSNTRASDTGISSVEQDDVMLRHGHLVANVSAPVSATAEIVAMSGATVRRIDFEPRCIFDEQIDLNGLPSGLYIIRCNIGDKKIEEKMVIR